MGLKLQDLRPWLYGRPRWENDRQVYDQVDRLDHAAGLCFLCPVCWLEAQRTHVNVHRIICWSPVVPQEFRPRPGRWLIEGTGFHDLTLRGSSDSVVLRGGCKAHFFVRQGEIQLV